MEIIFLVLISLSQGNLSQMEIHATHSLSAAKDMSCEEFVASAAFKPFVKQRFGKTDNLRYSCVGGSELGELETFFAKAESWPTLDTKK